MRTELVLDLPPGYRTQDVLSFHSRDAEGIAEQVTDRGLRKGVLLEGRPVLLEVDFRDDAAHCTIDADGDLTPALRARARRCSTSSACASTLQRSPNSRAMILRWGRSWRASPACASCSRPPCSKP
jgi:hypothetical protein